jgi:hypothetical protein
MLERLRLEALRDLLLKKGHKVDQTASRSREETRL